MLQTSFYQGVPSVSSTALSPFSFILPLNKLQGVLQRRVHLSHFLLEEDGPGSSSGQVLQESLAFVQFSDLDANIGPGTEQVFR